MSIEVRIPKIGISMTEATLTEWLVSDGDTVEAGTPLYALEMDKSTNEVDAPASGTIKLTGEVGEIYEVGDLIAIID